MLRNYKTCDVEDFYWDKQLQKEVKQMSPKTLFPNGWVNYSGKSKLSQTQLQYCGKGRAWNCSPHTEKTSETWLFKKTPICNTANRGCVSMKGECGLYTSMFSNVSAWLLILIQYTLYICVQKKPVNNSAYLCNMYVFLFLKDSTEWITTAYGKWLSCLC